MNDVLKRKFGSSFASLISSLYKTDVTYKNGFIFMFGQKFKLDETLKDNLFEGYKNGTLQTKTKSIKKLNKSTNS